ncbi:MAG: DegT/DnrJ/EryC1/StrS family aminotransferase [Breznakibacter sp.]
MNIQMVDLHGQYARLRIEIDEAMANVINHTQFINGPETKEFAALLETYLNVAHVLPCGNGTDALQLALMALGLKEGDEVITPTFTFGATVEVVALLGLKPVFVDADPQTFNIDVSKIKEAITSRTKAIIPVHLFGQGADMDGIMKVASLYNLFVVEDAAQCLGADYEFGDGTVKKLGTIGHVGCTSFFPSKNLGCFGDGGACFSNDALLAQTIKYIANHGSDKKYHHRRIGINSRLDTIQAAVLMAKLPHLDEFNHRRQQVAEWYDAGLSSIDEIDIPYRLGKGNHIFHQYTIKVKNGRRQQLADYLKQHGVPSMVYYPVPMHRQEAFRKYVSADDRFPVAEQLADEVLSLPMHTELTYEQSIRTTGLIRQFFTCNP